VQAKPWTRTTPKVIHFSRNALHVRMYRAEGLDLSLGGHWNLEAVLAITLLAAEHHMHGPTLSTHVKI
jgi:hypothetical protein